jgi:hypothetical protein
MSAAFPFSLAELEQRYAGQRMRLEDREIVLDTAAALRAHEEQYAETLERHFVRHLEPLARS